MFYIFKMNSSGIVILTITIVICLAIFGMMYYIEKKIKKLECK